MLLYAQSHSGPGPLSKSLATLPEMRWSNIISASLARSTASAYMVSCTKQTSVALGFIVVFVSRIMDFFKDNCLKTQQAQMVLYT